MRSVWLSITYVLLVYHASTLKVTPRSKRDSYVNAYKLTHDLNDHIVHTIQDDVRPVHENPEQPENVNVHPIYVHHHVDEVNSGEGFQQLQFQPVSANHQVGKPVGQLGNGYGPPSPVYIPPTVPAIHVSRPYAKATYIATPHYYEQGNSMISNFVQSFLAPQVLIALLEKIQIFKLDLFTIGKVMLKFVILKKILSFITILFLLLVIPSLQHSGKGSLGFLGSAFKHVGGAFGDEDNEEEDEDNDEEEEDSRAYRKRVTRGGRRRSRRRRRRSINNRLNSIALHVDEALESFERKFVRRPKGKDANSSNCDRDGDAEDGRGTVFCKSQSVVEAMRDHIPNTANITNSRQETQ